MQSIPENDSHKRFPYNQINLSGSLSTSRSDLVLAAIFLLITGLYGLLMVWDQVPAAGLAALGMMWLIYWGLSGWRFPATPMDLPILGLLLLLPISLAISIDWELSLPKVYGLVLGVSIYYWIVNVLRNYQRLHLAVLALIILALIIAILGLVGSDQSVSGISSISRISEQLPRLLTSVPRMTYGGINPNTIGGALVFFVPLLASLLWDGGAFKRKYLKGRQFPLLKIIGYKSLVLFVLALVLFSLLLTQSRGAYLGSAVGLLVMAIWKDRRFLWALPVMLAIFLIFLNSFEISSPGELIALLDTNEDSTIPGRLESWSNSIYLIKDFPFTGTGLSTYNRLFKEVYSFIPFSLQGAGSFHPHNTFLGVAIDLGIPALVLYLALLSSFAGMVWYTFKSKSVRSIIRVLLIGLACGLLAHQVFGITDAYLLGTKLGAIMWIFFGLAAAVYVQKDRFRWDAGSLSGQDPERMNRKPDWQVVKRHSGQLLAGMAAWILFSLIAVAFVNINVYLSLATAMLSGTLLGILLVRRYQSGVTHPLQHPVKPVKSPGGEAKPALETKTHTSQHISPEIHQTPKPKTLYILPFLLAAVMAPTAYFIISRGAFQPITQPEPASLVVMNAYTPVIETPLITPTPIITPPGTPTLPPTELPPTATLPLPLLLGTPVGIEHKFLVHRVLPGESLELIADNYNTTVQAIRSVNDSLPPALWENTLLVVPLDQPGVSGTAPMRAFLVEGEDLTIDTLASQLGVDPLRLRELNQLPEGYPLSPDSFVLVPVPEK